MSTVISREGWAVLTFANTPTHFPVIPGRLAWLPRRLLLGAGRTAKQMPHPSRRGPASRWWRMGFGLREPGRMRRVNLTGRTGRLYTSRSGYEQVHQGHRIQFERGFWTEGRGWPIHYPAKLGRRQAAGQFRNRPVLLKVFVRKSSRRTGWAGVVSADRSQLSGKLQGWGGHLQTFRAEGRARLRVCHPGP